MFAEKLDNATYFSNNGDIVRNLRAVAQPGDIILTVGAGDVFRIGEELLAQK